MEQAFNRDIYRFADPPVHCRGCLSQNGSRTSCIPDFRSPCGCCGASPAWQVLLLGQSAVFIHEKDRTLQSQFRKTRPWICCPVPSAFTPSGALKLCNLQMYRLGAYWRTGDHQQFHEWRQALGVTRPEKQCCQAPESDAENLSVRLAWVWRYSRAEITVPDGAVYTE